MAAIIPAAAIGAAVGAELPKFFDDAFDQFSAGEGIYLRDGEPSGVVAKIGQAVGRGYCRAYDEVSDQYTPEKAARIEKACRPYLDSIGSPGGPGLALPFRGGQCLCSVYSMRIDVTYTREGSNPPEDVQGFLLRRVRGPVVGGSVSLTDENRPIFTFVANAVSDNNSQSPSCRAEGTTQTRNFPTSQPAAQPGSLSAPTVTLTLVSGPDECGNPEPVPTVPDPRPNPEPPPFRFNPQPDIDIDIEVDIGPDGDIVFDIGTGPITVDPFADPGGGEGGPEPTPEPGEPGTGQDTGAGGEGADGDAPEGKVLTGVKLDIIEAPPSRRRFTEEVDRGVAYVYMGTPEEGLGLDATGSLVRSGQFFFAQKDYLTRYSVRANVGYNVRVTPYYRDKVE